MDSTLIKKSNMPLSPKDNDFVVQGRQVYCDLFGLFSFSLACFWGLYKLVQRQFLTEQQKIHNVKNIFKLTSNVK